jgi:hypothetical protein
MWDAMLHAKYFPSTSPPHRVSSAEFDNLFGQYEIVSDMPAIFFSPELI